MALPAPNSNPLAHQSPSMSIKLALGLGLCLALSLPAQNPETSYLFEIGEHLTEAQRAALPNLDVLHAHDAGIRKVVVPPAEIGYFRRLFPEASLLERGRPFAEILADRAQAAGPEAVPGDNRYFTVAEINQEMADLAAQYPDIAKVVDLSALPGASKTAQGRSIFALKVSNKVNEEEDQPGIIVAAQHHCRELNAPFMVIGAMRRLLASSVNDSVLSQVIYENEIYFVPMVNPDGVAHVWSVDNWWRKNRRNNGDGSFGVDLNRNYPTRWATNCGSSSNTSSNTYHGPGPASEPEVQTMRALAEYLRPELYLDFHSSGQEVLFTYPPPSCINPPLTAALSNFIQAFADDLRGPMNYATRVPSASGESPEDYWQNGAMAFLIEVGTSFQPPFQFTEQEEARVWPGVEQALINWDPVLRGHLSSGTTGDPIAGKIELSPGFVRSGESSFSRARDGRFAMWMPIGLWDVTFSAPGHISETRTIRVLDLGQRATIDLALEPLAELSSTPAEGNDSFLDLEYLSPSDAGQPYWIALSAGAEPGIDLGQRVLPLNPDIWMLWSINPGPLFMNNLGILGTGGEGTAQVRFPLISEFSGISLYALGMTLDPIAHRGLRRWSNPVEIQPFR